MQRTLSSLSVFKVVIALSLFDLWMTSAHADGGLLRYWERQGPYEIAVFTLPTPVTVGPMDVSVLVLHQSSGDPIADANVTVELEPVGHPHDQIHRAATTASATNKLLRSAVFDLPRSGPWDAEVTIEGTNGHASIRFGFEAAGSAPEWLALWPWVCWPFVVIAVYTIHQWLVDRKTRHHASKNVVTASRAGTRGRPSAP